MDISKLKTQLARAMRADAPYRGEVDRASAYVKIVFAPAHTDDRVALMAQVLADHGLELGPETTPEDAPPFDRMDADRITGIDVRLRQRAIDFAATFATSVPPVEEVARATVTFLADLTPEERAIALARMIREGLAPYAQIPAGWIEPDGAAVAARLTEAATSERFQRTFVLLERISRVPDLTDGQIVVAHAKLAAREIERPDTFANVIAATGYAATRRAAARTPSIAMLEVSGGLAAALAGVLGGGIEQAPQEVLEQHARTCEESGCGIKKELERRLSRAFSFCQKLKKLRFRGDFFYSFIARGDGPPENLSGCGCATSEKGTRAQLGLFPRKSTDWSMGFERASRHTGSGSSTPSP